MKNKMKKKEKKQTLSEKIKYLINFKPKPFKVLISSKQCIKNPLSTSQ